MSAFDLRSLLEQLHAREVRFVVIGGVAVAAHGYVRGTADLDLVPDPDPQNLKKVAQVLEELEAQGRPEDVADLANLPESGD